MVHNVCESNISCIQIYLFSFEIITEFVQARCSNIVPIQQCDSVWNSKSCVTHKHNIMTDNLEKSLFYVYLLNYAIKITCNDDKMDLYVYVITTELDKENPDFPPYLNCHGQKIGSSRVLRATRSELADCVCAALQAWSAQRGRNISTLKVAQSYSVSLRALFGKDPTQPNFCSIADGAIIRGGIGSSGSPYLILWL